MKRNWFIYICISLFMLGMLPACNEADFLNEEDNNNFPETHFWKDKADAESAVASIYSSLKTQMNGYYGAFDGWLLLNGRGDDMFTVIGEEASIWSISTFQNTPSTGADVYGKLFRGVQRTNVLLSKIDEIPSTGISDEDRSMIKGETLCLRAFHYYLLVTNYGSVPLRTIPSNKEEDNVLDKAPETTENIWAQIEQDLKDAIASPLPVTRVSGEKGRVEKGMAVAMLGKAYLAQKKYEEAKEQLKLLLSAPYTYALMDNYADNFTSLNKNNKESLFELQYGEQGVGGWGNEDGINLGNSIPQFIGPVASGGWSKLMPSAFIVGQFVKEERPAGSDTKFDKRMYSCLFFDPQTYGDVVPNEKWYGNNYSMDDLWKSNEQKMAGGAPTYNVNGQAGKFLLKKYTAYFLSDPTADNMNNTKGKANNIRVIRFAEVLLMYAEACAKTGDVDGANYALGLIRERAGLASKTFTQDQLMDEIEHQNLLEFFGEGHRFSDLVRWYSASEIQQTFKANAKQGAENFQEKHEYYPIPLDELRINKLMKQNPLWN